MLARVLSHGCVVAVFVRCEVYDRCGQCQSSLHVLHVFRVHADLIRISRVVSLVYVRLREWNDAVFRRKFLLEALLMHLVLKHLA